LSISSSISTGLRTPALRIACKDVPGQSADVRATMAANFGFVMDAAKATR